MAQCSAKCCPNYGKSTIPCTEDVSYHAFPKNPFARAKWIKQMNQDDFQPGPNSMLCSLHFIKEYFITDARGIQYLKQDAIPTEFEFDHAMELDASDDDTISCCAYNCSNKYNADSPITFHPFPLDHPELCDQWLLAMNVTQVAAKHAVLCSDHFHESCFVQGDNGEKLMISEAVPSIFDFPEEPENGDILNTVNLPIEAVTTLKVEDQDIDLPIELVTKHDHTVELLTDETQRLLELVKQRVKLEKEKKDIDFLLRTVLNGGPPLDKARFKNLRPLIKSIDEVAQAIVIDCLAPCVAIPDVQEQQLNSL